MSYGRQTCSICGERITTNALGRAAHRRSEKCQRVVFAKENGAVFRSISLFLLRFGRLKELPL